MSRSRGSAFVALIAALLCVGLGLAAPAFATAPTISSFTPTSGPMRAKVTITGTGFAAPATVRFGGVAGTGTVVVSSTSITSQVPPTAASGPISVTTPGGTATSTASFTVVPGAYATPTVGPPGGSTHVSFSGFAPYEAVDLYFDTTDLALASASSAGAGSFTVTVPNSATPGAHYFTVVGRHSGYSAQTAFTVRTDWPQDGFDAGHTGDNTAEHTLGAANVAKLSRVWRHPIADYAVSVAGGLVYVGTPTGITALVLATGAVKWTAATSGSVNDTPAVSGSLVYVNDSKGDVYGFNATTGAQVWKAAAGDPSDESDTDPVVANGLVYVEIDNTNFDTGALDAFSPTGSLAWSYGLGTECYGAAVVGTVLYDACEDGSLFALDVSTSSPTPIWDVSGDGYEADSQANVVVANGLVYLEGYDTNSDFDNTLWAFEADTGDLVWNHDFSEDNDDIDQLSGLSVADNVVYERAESAVGDTLYALRAGTGRVLWTQSVTSSSTPVAVANGLVYSNGYGGLDVLDATSGALVLDLRGNGTSPIVTDSGVITGIYGASTSTTSLVRYALPQSAMSSGARPMVSALHPNRSLRVQRASR